MPNTKKYSGRIIMLLLYIAAALLGSALLRSVRRARKEEYYTLVANIKKTDELKVGAAVRFSGMDVGRISKMELLPDYSVDVSMEIGRGVEIPEDSVAAIYTDGIMGAKYVAVIAGGSEDTMKDGGSFEYTQDSVNIYEMLETGIENFSKAGKDE
jgi:phospholipid/cholesterol/gamma-HCH transport system substrate-binding protein